MAAATSQLFVGRVTALCQAAAPRPALGVGGGTGAGRGNTASGLRSPAASPGRVDFLRPRRLPASACPDFLTGLIRGACRTRALLARSPTPAARVDLGAAGAPRLRVVTGAAMAGVYPVAMKLAATWARATWADGRDSVGALTLGSALPHLFNAFGGIDWRVPVVVSSVSALAAAALIGFAGLGPNRAPSPPFDLARCCPPGATFRCGSPTWAISGTCGSSMRCGRGSACSWRPASRSRCRRAPRRRPPS